MPRIFRTGAGLAALTLTALAACTDADDPSAAPTAATAGPVPSASLRALDEPDTGRVIERLENRTGSWTATVGSPSDTGPIDISITCVGGGSVEVTHSVGSMGGASGTTPCGETDMHNRDEAAAPGPITVSVEPGSDQRWSLLIVRGMEME